LAPNFDASSEVLSDEGEPTISNVRSQVQRLDIQGLCLCSSSISQKNLQNRVTISLRLDCSSVDTCEEKRMTVRPLAVVLQGLRHLLRTEVCADSDGQLLDRFVKSRDETAFTALLSRHGAMVWGVCRRVVGHEQDAEDAFQATFLVLARRARDLDRRHSVAGWLHTVAYHTALRARGISARRQQCERPLDQEPLSPQPTAEHDLRPVLEEELHRLPTRYRVPLVLCYLEGKTNEEAAQQLRCPIGTVKGRLSRAREMLRARLVRRGIALSGTVAGSLTNTATAVPAGLMASTGRMALLCMAGEQSLLCSTSPTVHTLTTGVLKTMFLAKIKFRALCLAVMLILCLGLGTYGYFAFSNDTEPAPSAAGEPKLEPAKKEMLLHVLTSYNTPVGANGPAFDGPKVLLTRPNTDGKNKK
jgi:RNA polymerase sigma factor (sigma-70 family)